HAADKEIFGGATERGLTIITQGDAEFTAIMRHAMHTIGRTNCAGEGYSLLVPNSLTVATRHSRQPELFAVAAIWRRRPPIHHSRHYSDALSPQTADG